MDVKQWIAEHSSSDIERKAAEAIADNFLLVQILRDTSDANFAACAVSTIDGVRKLVLNGRDSTFELTAGLGAKRR